MSENEPLSHTEIQANFEAKYKQEVTRVIKDLAGIEEGRNESNVSLVWANRPLVTGRRDGWRMTSYGDALDHYIEEQNTSLAEILLFGGMPDGVLENAIDEVFT